MKQQSLPRRTLMKFTYGSVNTTCLTPEEKKTSKNNLPQLLIAASSKENGIPSKTFSKFSRRRKKIHHDLDGVGKWRHFSSQLLPFSVARKTYDRELPYCFCLSERAQELPLDWQSLEANKQF